MVSQKWKGDLDLEQVGHLLGALLESVAGNPASPVESQIWYDSTAKKLKFRSNAGNIDPTDRAQHTGTQVAATISDFMATVFTARHDQLAAPTADVPWNSRKITGLADPTAAQDAATKAYVDAARSGLDVKASVRLATAAALPAHTVAGNVLTASANAALSVDGVAVVVGDRILVKDEGGGTSLQNGIYDVTQTGSGAAPWILTRSADADTSAEVTAGMFTFVAEGTANADSGFVLSTNDAIVLNTTALTFTQFSGAGTFSAGAGITKTGTTFDVIAGTTPASGGPGGGLIVHADDVVVDTAIVTIKKLFNVGDGAATSYVLNHALGTRDVMVQVYLNSGTFETVHVHAERTDANNVTLIFPSAPAVNAYRCVIQG